VHCSDIAISSWLGGQHGEEIEDEVCGEEDGEEDQAQERSEEEVAFASSERRSASTNVEDCVTRTGGVAAKHHAVA
jgi:hypothetical protein